MSSSSEQSMGITAEGELNNQLWYPPGGVLMWLIVLVEILFFGIALVFVSKYHAMAKEDFALQQQALNLNMGIFLTVSLLVSGWQVAEYVHHRLHQQTKKMQRSFGLALFFGFLFIAAKVYDYSAKISHGNTFGSGDFWDYYWFLTSVHFLHVLIGLGILLAVYFKDQSEKNKAEMEVAVQSGALFWHMCDVIWLFIFPIFYLGITR